MLSRFGIGTRLALAFSLVVVIMMIATGITFMGFLALRAALADVRSQSAQIVLAKDAQSKALNVMTYIGAVAASEETSVQQNYLAKITGNRDAYKINLDNLKTQAVDEKTKQLLAAVEAAISSSRDTNNAVLALAKDKKNLEAMQQYSALAVPKLQMWTDAFDNVNVHRQEVMEQSLKQAEARIQQNIVILLVAGSIAALLAAVLGFIITRSIVAPIRGFMGVLGQLAEGDLTLEAKVDSKDEIGHLG